MSKANIERLNAVIKSVETESMEKYGSYSFLAGYLSSMLHCAFRQMTEDEQDRFLQLELNEQRINERC